MMPPKFLVLSNGSASGSEQIVQFRLISLAWTYAAALVDGCVLLRVRQLASSLELIVKALELFRHTDQCHLKTLSPHGNAFATYAPPVPY
jgi:hypothetical protein